MPIASINPATGEKLKEFSPFDDAEIEKRLKRAENASRKYRRTAFGQRSELMEATAELLLQEKDRLAGIITLEMGKLFTAFTPTTGSGFLRTSRHKRTRPAVMSTMNHSAWSSPLCRGISHSGRCSDLPRRR